MITYKLSEKDYNNLNKKKIDYSKFDIKLLKFEYIKALNTINKGIDDLKDVLSLINIEVVYEIAGIYEYSNNMNRITATKQALIEVYQEMIKKISKK